ncbi:MAG: hypothetical protein ACJ72D_16290 [Marmoricola sp.]
MKAPRPVLLAAGVVMLLATGCSNVGHVHTGDVAATVGDHTVTKSDVDLLAGYQCDLIDAAAKDPSQQAQVIPLAKVRAYIATALINNALDLQIARKAKVTVSPSLYRSDLTQALAASKQIPAKDRDRFNALALESIRSGYAIQILAGRKLAPTVGAQPSQDQVVQAVSELRNAYRKTVKVDVDPVYGISDDGSTVIDPSISRAVSSYAKSSVIAQPGQAFLTALAPNQKCG